MAIVLLSFIHFVLDIIYLFFHSFRVINSLESIFQNNLVVKLLNMWGLLAEGRTKAWGVERNFAISKACFLLQKGKSFLI